MLECVKGSMRQCLNAEMIKCERVQGFKGSRFEKVETTRMPIAISIPEVIFCKKIILGLAGSLNFVNFSPS